MDAFEALVRSFGDQLAGHIGSENLHELTVWFDAVTSTARVEVCLRDDSLDAEFDAISRIGEVRMIFLGELSFDYYFADPGNCHQMSGEARTNELVFS